MIFIKVTTRDIAKAAGVSQSAVSIALNKSSKVAISQETRAHIIATAEKMGYQFKKRNKSVNDLKLVGLLVPTLTNYYYPMLIQSVTRYAETMGIGIVVQNTLRSVDQELNAFHLFGQIGVSGILCLYSPKTTPPDSIPSVIVGEKLANVNLDTISLNSYEAGRIAAKHLLSLGHRDIAYISSPLTNVTDARSKRLDGIRSAMEEAGYGEHLLTLIDEEENEKPDDFYEYHCGAKLTEQLLQMGSHTTAIIAVNDMTACGCVSMLNKKGIRIPEQMAICGFDNLLLGEMICPQLTSVEQMAFHGCKIGLSVLAQKMNDPTDGKETVFMEYQPKLYVRQSTAGTGAGSGQDEN